MEVIELDQEFFDSVKNVKREDVVNGMVKNVMSGRIEYRGTSDNFILQDFVNDALGDYAVGKLVCGAVANQESFAFCHSAINSVKDRVYESLMNQVLVMLNQYEVGIA